jgi:signal transduction histidine kinase
LRLAYSLDPYVEHAVFQDMSRIQEAVSEVLMNALKVTERGEIVVSLRSLGASSSVIIVRDTGPGMSERQLQTMLHAIRNGDPVLNSNQRKPGEGLGLAFHIMERLGGRLVIESKLNVGTTVRLEFPNVYNRRNESRFMSFFSLSFR